MEKLDGTVKEVMAARGESYELVRQKLRQGRYRARKDGKMTKIVWASVIEDFNNLPVATFGEKSLPCSPQLQRKTENTTA